MFAAASAVLAKIDSDTLRLPNRVVFTATALVVLATVPVMVVNAVPILPAVAVTLVATAVMHAVFVMARGQLGFGDVKITPLIAWVVTVYAGAEAMWLCAVLTAAVFGIAGAVTLALQRFRSRNTGGGNTDLAAGPLMFLASWLTLFAARH